MSSFSRLKERINSLFIIGKSIDFILVFVGLILAIQVNSYIVNKKREETYKKTLIRLHTEISINRIFLKKYSNSIQLAENITSDLAKLQSKGFSESYDGILRIQDLILPEFIDSSFKATEREDYLDNNFYSKIKILYEGYNKLENKWNIQYNHIKKLYKAYFDIYGTIKLKHLGGQHTADSLIVDISDFFNNGNNTLKHSHWSSVWVDSNNSGGEILLKEIEKKLSLFEVDINDLRDFNDYYWLSYYTLMEEGDYENSLILADMGLKDLNEYYGNSEANNYEYKSFLGRLNRNIVFSIKGMLNNEDKTYSKYDLLPYLNQWYNSGIYREACLVEYLDYYYKNNDFNKFMKYTNEILELDSYKYYKQSLHQWPDYMTKDSVMLILNKLDSNIDWNSFIFPRVLN